MKLRNKKTGETGNLVLNINPNRESYSVLSTENGDTVCGNLVLADYDSLAELCKEWEDVPEEPKNHWMIDTSVLEPVREIAGQPYEIDIEIGNWFESKEEAEKAVEKLKAWKRLKDKGFRFTGFDNEAIGYEIKELSGNFSLDLDLLFWGGEE